MEKLAMVQMMICVVRKVHVFCCLVGKKIIRILLDIIQNVCLKIPIVDTEVNTMVRYTRKRHRKTMEKSVSLFFLLLQHLFLYFSSCKTT